MKQDEMKEIARNLVLIHAKKELSLGFIPKGLHLYKNPVI